MLSISLDIAGEPKKTDANTGSVESIKVQIYASILSFAFGPISLSPSEEAKEESFDWYLKER